jgi:hypothetical protein
MSQALLERLRDLASVADDAPFPYAVKRTPMLGIAAVAEESYSSSAVPRDSQLSLWF